MTATLSPATDAPPRSFADDLPDVRSAHMLVVDDETTTVEIARHLLKSDGFHRVSSTTDGYEAACLIRDSEPDLVLLDLMMPGVSGLDVLEEVRGCAETAFIPVVILTAETDRTVRRDALDRGATDFINKPIDGSEVLPRVRNILSVKRYQDALRRQNEDLE